MAFDGSSVQVKPCRRSHFPSRRSTQAPKTEPRATGMNLSQGSAWMPRVTPRLLVVGDVVLDDPEVGDAECGHLGALPVLLEPAARVAVDGQVDDLEAPDAGLGDGEVLLECDVCHCAGAPIEEVQVAGARAGRRIIPMPCGPARAPRGAVRRGSAYGPCAR